MIVTGLFLVFSFSAFSTEDNFSNTFSEPAVLAQMGDNHAVMAEVLFKRTVIEAIESAQNINSALGLDAGDITSRIVTIPASLYLAYNVYRVSGDFSGIIRFFTPNKRKSVSSHAGDIASSFNKAVDIAVREQNAINQLATLKREAGQAIGTNPGVVQIDQQISHLEGQKLTLTEQISDLETDVAEKKQLTDRLTATQKELQQAEASQRSITNQANQAADNFLPDQAQDLEEGINQNKINTLKSTQATLQEQLNNLGTHTQNRKAELQNRLSSIEQNLQTAKNTKTTLSATAYEPYVERIKSLEETVNWLKAERRKSSSGFKRNLQRIKNSGLVYRVLRGIRYFTMGVIVIGTIAVESFVFGDALVIVFNQHEDMEQVKQALTEDIQHSMNILKSHAQ